MPPKKTRQKALNYQKRKKRSDDSVQVEGGVESGERVVEDEIVSNETMVEDDMVSEDECEPGSSSEKPVAKRRQLSAIGRIAEEPIQSWLDQLPRDDSQHLALLLCTRLPTVFGLQKNRCSCCCR